MTGMGGVAGPELAETAAAIVVGIALMDVVPSADVMLTMEQCMQMLLPLKDEPNAVFFLAPVDHVALKLPDYPTVVTHPMDLGTIEKKLEKRQYESSSAFVDDVRLVWANARRYNPISSIVYKAASQLLAVFERRLWGAAHPGKPLPATMQAAATCFTTKFEAAVQAIINQDDLLILAGETPNELHSDKLGEYLRCCGQEVNGRPIYTQVFNDNRMLWYAAGYWFLGMKNELGQPQGWLRGSGGIWSVGDGDSWYKAPNVRCKTIGAVLDDEAKKHKKAAKKQRKKEREREEQERAARERAARRRATREAQKRVGEAAWMAAQERAAQERAATERAAQERATQEQAAQERAAREKAAQERAAQERAAAREKATQERAARERAARERAARERAARERAAQERAAQEIAASCIQKAWGRRRFRVAQLAQHAELEYYHELQERKQQSRDKSEDKSDDNCCVVCMDATKTHLMVPCGHKCVCETCAAAITKECPICRNNITTILRVYE